MDFSTRSRAGHSSRDVVLVGCAALVFAGAAWNALAARAERSRVESAAAEAKAALSAAETRLRSLEGRRPGEADRLATRVEMTAEAPPFLVLGAIAALLPDGARLRSASLDYADGVGIALDVEARSAPAWDDFLERLSRSGRFDTLRPAQEEREGEMQTSLRMNWRGSAP